MEDFSPDSIETTIFLQMYKICSGMNLTRLLMFEISDPEKLSVCCEKTSISSGEQMSENAAENMELLALQHTATHCNTLQHTATHCNTLQHTATHCNTLQHTATHFAAENMELLAA